MTVYSGPVFDMAVNQFRVIANHLEIPMDERDRILLPKRAITVSCPIHRDDGTVTVFEGYRVQHHLTLGPTKGGTRFAPSVDIGEIAALAIWMAASERDARKSRASGSARHGAAPAKAREWRPSAPRNRRRSRGSASARAARVGRAGLR